LIQPAHPLARGLVACWLMNEGSGNRTKDLCVSTPDTFSGGTLFVPGKFGPCLSFDGTGDFIRRASGLLATVPFTVVAWAKCPDPTAGHAIFWMGDSTIGDQYFGLYLSSSGYAAAAHRTNSGGQDIAIGTVVAADGMWHQLAGVFVNNSLRHVYLDGRKGATNTGGNQDLSAFNRTTIGRFDDSTPTIDFIGSIDHVLVYNRALTDAEIAQLYTDPFAMFRRPRIELWLPAAGGHAYTETINDGIGIADAETPLRAWVRSIVNSLGLADIAGRMAAQSRTEADGVGLTDAASSPVGYIKPMQDTVGMDDAASSLIGYIRTMQDGIGVADAASRLFAATRANADTVGMDDAASSAWSAIRQVADDLGLTDAIARIVRCLRTINDGLGLTDDDAHSQAVARALIDEMGIVDAIARIFIVARLITDLEGLTDQVVRGSVLIIADAMGMTDDVGRLLACLRTLADSMGVTDSTSRAAASLRTISETLGLADVMSEQFSGLVAAATIFLLLKKHR